MTNIELTILTPSTCKLRGTDSYGSGAFGASRGSRTHNGIDFLAEAGSYLTSPISGTITKLGYPYADDLSYRYIQISSVAEDGNEYHHRFFYVNPCKKVNYVGCRVKTGDVVGTVQDLTGRYPGIKNHLHYEIRHKSEYKNPEDLWSTVVE